MAKRNSGEGVIYREKNRGLWIYQVSYKGDAGMRKRKKFAAKTKQEAMEKGRKFLMGQGQLQDNSRKTIFGSCGVGRRSISRYKNKVQSSPYFDYLRGYSCFKKV